jgi:predicted HD phosphohydrolase
MSHDEQRPRATFTALDQGSDADWAIISAEFVRFASELPDRVLGHLSLLAGSYNGFPIDRLTHSLQAATLAHEDGRDDEYVACALLHDIGDSLGAYNHPEIAAAILRPFVSEANHWMVEKHGIFQFQYMFRHAGMEREMPASIRTHPYFARTEEFSLKYDSRAFDPRGRTRPLEFFEPIVRRLFAGPRHVR